MDYNKLQIKEFDLTTIVDHAAIVIIARRGSGKSFVTRDILYSKRHIPGGVVIAPTDKMNGEYKKFFPDIFIHYVITEEILNKILLRQREMMEKQKVKKKEGKTLDPSGVLVMDDCLAQKKTWAKIQAITEILMNGRHYKLTYILTMQSPMGLPPDLRLNFDYVFLLKEVSAINRKKIWMNYASMFPSLDYFEKVFSKTTENFCSMVIDNRKPSDQLSDIVFWFKAKERRFTFGCKGFRAMHDKYFDVNYYSKSHQALKEGAKLFGKKKNEIDFKIERV